MLLQLFDVPSSTYTYIVADDESREAAIIDPVLGHADRDLSELARHGFKLRWVLDTHVHADHETGANALKAATGAGTAIGAQCGSIGHDQALVDGDRLPLGNGVIHVIATPGHTPGSSSYLWGKNVFTGDTLLIEGCGRTDFQNGNSEAMYHSITAKLFGLPDDTIVWPGHDYRYRHSSTIGHEKRHNPRFAGKDVATFSALMKNLKLAPPTMLDQAVLANRHGGALQSGEAVPAMLTARKLESTFDAARDALVDLRDAPDFLQDSLSIAVRMDCNNITALADLAKQHRKLFLICRSGRRSLVAADALLKIGVENVCTVTGGMLALRNTTATALEPHA